MAADQFPGAELSQTVYAIADALGGSISAEHGIGVARRGDLARFKDPESIALMRAVKHALDPDERDEPARVVAVIDDATHALICIACTHKLASDAKQCDVAISSREKFCVTIVLAQHKPKT